MNAAPNHLPPGLKKKKAPQATLPLWFQELGLIRRALVCLMLTSLAASFMIVLSNRQRERASDRLELVREARNVASDKFNHVENEKLEIRSYQPPFISLQNKGLIGEENRLEWIDAIRRIQERRKLLPITYEIDAQQALRLDTRMAMGQYQLRGSKMELHMDLLHEMDLLNFFDDLKQRNYYAVQDCTLKRTAAAQNAGLAPTVSADCTVYWLTLGMAPGTAAKVNGTAGVVQ